jgi:hypothetical protein
MSLRCFLLNLRTCPLPIRVSAGMRSIASGECSVRGLNDVDGMVNISLIDLRGKRMLTGSLSVRNVVSFGLTASFSYKAG